MYLASSVLLGIVIELAYLLARTVCKRRARRYGTERAIWPDDPDVPPKRHHTQGNGPCIHKQVLEGPWHARPSTSQVPAATIPHRHWAFLHLTFFIMLLLLSLECLSDSHERSDARFSPSVLVQSVWFPAEVPCTALGVLVKNQVLPAAGPCCRDLML